MVTDDHNSITKKELQVVSNYEYQAMYPNSLFQEIRDSDWYSPNQPDSTLTDLIHRGHRGHVSFHRLSPTLKNDKGKPLFQDLYSLKATDVKEHFQKIAPDLQHDSFFSINGMNRGGWNPSRINPQFKGALRNGASVEYLTSCFVDIDCLNLGITVGTAIGQVIDASDQGQIPKPSIFVRSGNGLWLFWLLRAGRDDPAIGEKTNGPVRAFSNRICNWSRIQHKIFNIFARIGADKNAKDSARITRILGTQNMKTFLRTNAKVYSDIWLSCASCGQSSSIEVVAYTLEELALKFNVRQDMDETSWSRSKVAKISDPRYRLRGIKGSLHLWQKRLNGMLKLFSSRYGMNKRFRIGNRRKVALLYARCLFGAQERKDMNLIRESLERFNRNMMEQGHGVDRFDIINEVFESKGWERFKYFDLTIAQTLEITDEESQLCGLPTEAQANEAKLVKDSRKTRTQKRNERHLLIQEWAISAPLASVATSEAIFNHLTIGHGIDVSLRTVANDITFLVSSGRVPASKFGRKANDQTVEMFPLPQSEE